MRAARAMVEAPSVGSGGADPSRVQGRKMLSKFGGLEAIKVCKK